MSEQFIELLFRAAAMHGLQNALVTMLNRDIDIGKHFRGIANRSDKLIGHALGLQLENSNPYVQRTKRSASATRS